MLKKSYKVLAVPLFSDNYSYIIFGTAKSRLVLVDPANPAVITTFLNTNFPSYLVSHILYTHKHWDHAGGSSELVGQLKKVYDSLQVMIGENDFQSVEGANYPLKGLEELKVGNSTMRTLSVPCHTRGHIIYNFLPCDGIESEGIKMENLTTIQGKKVRVFESSDCSFTGDTLFNGGVGRFFEGNAAEMVNNIKMIDKYISPKSDIFDGHQYTLNNLKWSKDVEKENQEIQFLYADLKNASQKQGVDFCSLPTTMLQQKQINLFVRAVTGTPLHKSICEDPVKLMEIFREMKNANKTNFEVKSKI